MVRILLPFLMLVSLSVFAQPDFTVGFKSVDVVDITQQPMLVAQTVRPCTTSNESFDRLCIATGAATQYADLRPSIAKSNGMLLNRSLPNEVGWRRTHAI